jgi:hypothetical protein
MALRMTGDPGIANRQVSHDRSWQVEEFPVLPVGGFSKHSRLQAAAAAYCGFAGAFFRGD